MKLINDYLHLLTSSHSSKYTWSRVKWEEHSGIILSKSITRKVGSLSPINPIDKLTLVQKGSSTHHLSLRFKNIENVVSFLELVEYTQSVKFANFFYIMNPPAMNTSKSQSSVPEHTRKDCTSQYRTTNQPRATCKKVIIRYNEWVHLFTHFYVTPFSLRYLTSPTSSSSYLSNQRCFSHASTFARCTLLYRKYVCVNL